MNPIAEEMKEYFGCGETGEKLAHYGMPRRSGRYPYGSEMTLISMEEISCPELMSLRRLVGLKHRRILRKSLISPQHNTEQRKPSVKMSEECMMWLELNLLSLMVLALPK